MSDERGTMASVRRVAPILLYVLVALVALLPRVLDLGTFVTHDEAEFWIDRSEQFLLALQSGNYADTAISTHPGVTTMWLGMVGIFLRRAARAWGLVQEVPFPLLLALMQLPVALVHSGGVVVGYALLRRLLPPATALLAALLWATDPFVIGYSRVLHVDALAGTFATLSLLAAAVGMRRGGDAKKRRGEEAKSHAASPPGASPPGASPPGASSPPRVPASSPPRVPASSPPRVPASSPPRVPASPSPRLPASPPPGWLVLSGIFAGLAVLSKSPALAVVPVVGILLLAEVGRRGGGEARTRGGVVSRITHHASRIIPLSLWAAAAALTIVLVWPAVWADPARVYTLLRVGVEVEGANPHMTGNFFLGHIDPAPGPLYYPVALALRMTPWTLAGVALLLLALVRLPRLPASPPLRLTSTLAGFVLLFTLGMTLFPKKFDRYLVPVFPSLDILAAVGIAWASNRLASLRRRVSSPHTASRLTAALPHLISVIVIGAALLNVAWFHPYNLIYFNQALGGVPRGVRTFSVGWGEGYDQVAAYLNQQPDITGVVTAATMMKTLNPYLRHGAQATTPRSPELPDKTGYVVVYIYQAQGTVFPPFDQFYPHARPLHTVTLHGVDYAWVYQVAPAVAHPRPATFGDTLYLRGFDITGNTQAGQTLTLHLFWQTESAPAADTWLFAHLLSPDGTRLFQLDLPYPTSTWGAHRFVTTELPVTIPPDTPPGTYPLLIGMYDDPASGQRLPLESATTAPPALDGENVLLLYEVRVGE